MASKTLLLDNGSGKLNDTNLLRLYSSDSLVGVIGLPFLSLGLHLLDNIFNLLNWMVYLSNQSSKSLPVEIVLLNLIKVWKFHDKNQLWQPDHRENLQHWKRRFGQGLPRTTSLLQFWTVQCDQI